MAMLMLLGTIWTGMILGKAGLGWTAVEWRVEKIRLQKRKLMRANVIESHRRLCIFACVVFVLPDGEPNCS